MADTKKADPSDGKPQVQDGVAQINYEGTEPQPGVNASRGRRAAAYDKLRNLIISYPKDTPNEHVLFGYGQVRVTLGEMRMLFQ